MDEDKYIEERVGKRNPFLVPDGYFDEFAAQLMQSLPERPRRAKSIWLRPVFYAAACVCALLICTAVYVWKPEPAMQRTETLAVQQDQSDTSFDEVVDYMMMDDHEIYACLSDN